MIQQEPSLDSVITQLEALATRDETLLQVRTEHKPITRWAYTLLVG